MTTVTTPRPSNDEKALHEVKVRIIDITEWKALWTTINNKILKKLTRMTKGVRMVEVKKLLNRDIIIQTKEREGKEQLAERSKRLEGVTPSA